jgi:hypothetical protein
MKRWPVAAVVVTLVLAFLVVLLGVLGVVALTTIGRLNAEVDDLATQLADAEVRIAELEAELENAQGAESASIFQDLLGGLLGEQGGDLGDLLGGEGGLGDLLGGLGGADFASCLTGTPGDITISGENLETQVDEIADAVADLRELEFPAEVEPVFVSPEEMGERVRELAAEALPDDLVEFDTRLWVALAMLPPGFDLAETQLDLLDSAVAGYYDPDTGELVVSTNASDSPLGAIDQVILAHELIHALTDARLGFPDLIDDPRADPERVRAIQALIEGDATLGMQQFSLGALDLMDQFGMLTDPRLAASQADLEDVPYLLSNGLQLPYLEGMNFACSLYGESGWAAVDAAYDAPPTTTAEILFPDLYANGWEPRDPAAAGQPGDGWTELRTVGFGAVDLLHLFSAPGDDPGAALSDVRGRVRGWGGGTATVWTRGEDTAVLLNLVDAAGGGNQTLCESMETWVRAASIDNSVVDCVDQSVQIGIGPDVDIARAIVE